MGADLVGYHVAFPVKEGLRIIKEQIKKIETIIKSGGGWDNLLADGCAVEIQDAVLGKLADMGAEADGSDLQKDELSYLKADLELMKTIKTQGDFACRDLVWYSAKINKQEVRFMFAGEMTWGDEPDGTGYILLRALVRLGIEHHMYQVIKWGN